MLMESSRGRSIACNAYYTRLLLTEGKPVSSIDGGARTASQAREEGTRYPMTGFLSWACMALDWTVTVALSSWYVSGRNFPVL